MLAPACKRVFEVAQIVCPPVAEELIQGMIDRCRIRLIGGEPGLQGCIRPAQTRQGPLPEPFPKGQTDFFANFTVQYVGSSFSQFENEEPGFGVICTTCPDPVTNPNAANLRQYGGPLAVSQINFNPELPSYTLANFRLGLKTDRWQAAAYINNIADKNAQLALDYERGRSARVGYLTNQPRTIGVYGSYIF